MANEYEPINRDPNGPSGVFYYNQIWLGPTPPPGHTGRFLTKQDDVVYKFNDDNVKEDFRVTFVDGLGIPTLVKLQDSNPLGGEEEDVFRGSDLASDEDILRCFIDSSVLPMLLSIDGRLEVHGNDVSHYKVFKGIDYSAETGEVISAVYNPAGQILSENIPMQIPDGIQPDEYLGRIPAPGFSTEGLSTGDVVTVVVYTSDDRKIRIRRMQVENTNFIRRTEASKRLVTDIRLISPYLSTSEANLLEYPVNITMDTAHINARVTYTNGYEDIPVDGSRFAIAGMNDSIFTSATEGQEITLLYTLGSNEEAFSVQSITENGKIAKTYRIRGVEYPGAYNVKIFTYPEWVDVITGYRLRHWLHDIDRQAWLDVTSYVQIAANSEPFRPKTFGVLQSLTLALDLRQVNPNYREVRHVQTLGIVLQVAGNVNSTPRWKVFFHETQNPPFGQQAIARIQHITSNTYSLDVSSGYTTQENWAVGLYYASFPLIGGQEASPPHPTNFTVEMPNGLFDYSMSQWNSVLNITGSFGNGKLVVIHFWRTMGSERIQLGTIALPVTLT